MNQFNAFGNGQQMPFGMVNHNPYGPSFGHSPLHHLSNEEVIKQLQAFAAYASLPPAAMALMAELHKRANESFNTTFTPTKEVQGNGFLYTSIYKDGLMTHYFVDDEDTKKRIDFIFESTWVRDEETGCIKESEIIPGSKKYSPARINQLLGLGNDVFRVISVDSRGVQRVPAKTRGFSSLFSDGGFNTEPRHPSAFLPVIIIEIDVQALLSVQPHHWTGMLWEYVRGQVEKGKVTKEQLSELGKYLDGTDRLKEYAASIDQDHFVNARNPLITQIHLFPADKETPIKFVGGQTSVWNEGQIDRNLYPDLFVGPANGPGSNGYAW